MICLKNITEADSKYKILKKLAFINLLFGIIFDLEERKPDNSKDCKAKLRLRNVCPSYLLNFSVIQFFKIVFFFSHYYVI